MNTYLKKINSLLTGLLILPLLACNSDTNLAQKKSAVADETKQTHRTIKPHAPIFMRYTQNTKQSIEVGQLVSYVLHFSASVSADNLQISYRAKDALLIQNESLSASFGAQKKGQSNDLMLNVIPQKNGEHYIYVSARLDVQGKSQSRSFVIPLKVGGPGAKKMKQANQGKLLQNIDGQRAIISMPAVEK